MMHGNQEVNNVISLIKETLGITDFRNSQKHVRQFGMHLSRLLEKMGEDEFISRLCRYKKSINKNKGVDILSMYRAIKAMVKETDEEKSSNEEVDMSKSVHNMWLNLFTGPTDETLDNIQKYPQEYYMLRTFYDYPDLFHYSITGDILKITMLHGGIISTAYLEATDKNINKWSVGSTSISRINDSGEFVREGALLKNMEGEVVYDLRKSKLYNSYKKYE